jgi:hypothetical protein
MCTKGENRREDNGEERQETRDRRYPSKGILRTEKRLKKSTSGPAPARICSEETPFNYEILWPPADTFATKRTRRWEEEGREKATAGTTKL